MPGVPRGSSNSNRASFLDGTRGRAIEGAPTAAQALQSESLKGPSLDHRVIDFGVDGESAIIRDFGSETGSAEEIASFPSAEGRLCDRTIPAERYIQLLKRTLTRSVSDRDIRAVEYALSPTHRALYAPLQRIVRRRGAELLVSRAIDPKARELGRDWPYDAETMIGMKRLTNLQQCIEDVVVDGVPGDLLEAGVWRGGACIFMRAMLDALGETSRKVWVADSFQGVPKPDSKYVHDHGLTLYKHEILRVSLDQVRANFERYGFLDDRVIFLPGFFKDTLSHAPVDRLAVLRLDGDLYQSTMESLTALYSKVSVGGYVIVDDYGGIRACRQAVDDFRTKLSIQTPMTEVDWTGVYWRKE